MRVFEVGFVRVVEVGFVVVITDGLTRWAKRYNRAMLNPCGEL